MTYLDVLAEPERRRVGPAIAGAVADGRAWRGSVTALTQGRSPFPAHLAISCVFDARRDVLGAVGVLRDLTDQVETQRRLIQRILGPVIDAARAPGDRRVVRIEKHGLDAGIVATVDGPRLRQVFTNVLKNALDPRVDITLGLRNDAAIVEIIGNGSGMAPEQRDKVFDRNRP